MSKCCESDPAVSLVAKSTACPSCRRKGVPVELQTVKAMLTEMALRRFQPTLYRFCDDAACDVVYFDESGQTFATTDVRVPVWQKEPYGNRMICYCFGESEADIRAETVREGASRAVERVTAHIKAHRCACELRNPRGTCCLGDVMTAIKRMSASVQSSVEA